MDIRINPLSSQALTGLGGLASKRPAGTGGVDGGFAGNFKNALQAVSQAQNEVSAMRKDFSLENPEVSLEQVMIAGEKAKLGFTAAIGVRNRLVQAYSEIMNMQV